MLFMECRQSWLRVEKTPSSASFWRLPLGSQKGRIPEVDTHGHLGRKCPVGVGKFQINFCVLFHLYHKNPLNSLGARMQPGPDPLQLLSSMCQAVRALQ